MKENSEIPTKAIAVTFKAAQLTSQVLQDAIKLWLALLAKQQRTGQQSLRKLSRSGRQINAVTMQLSAPEEFKALAKENRLTYSLAQSKTSPDTYTIFFKVSEMNLLQNALKKMVTARLDAPDAEQKPSVKDALEEIKAQQRANPVAAQTMQRKHSKGAIPK